MLRHDQYQIFISVVESEGLDYITCESTFQFLERNSCIKGRKSKDLMLVILLKCEDIV